MRILPNQRDELKVLERYVHEHARDGHTLEILEAGCGRRWELNMDGIEFRLTGVDLDEAAMEARRSREQDLSVIIIGDLRTVDLESEKYDVIYSSFVLEHVEGAERVLENFLRWLKPGGIIIIRVPDRDSAHGFVTRFTPFWAHVLYYRYVWGDREAGQPGFPPYRTVYDAVVSRRGFREFAAAHDLVVREEIGSGSYLRGHGVLRALTPVVANIVSALSFGRFHSKYVDATYILEKPI